MILGCGGPSSIDSTSVADKVKGFHICSNGVQICYEDEIYKVKGLSLVGLAIAPSHIVSAGGVWEVAFRKLEVKSSAEASFDIYKSWGVNTLRLQVSAPSLQRMSPTLDTTYAPYILERIKWIRAAGFKIILSMRHMEPKIGTEPCSEKLPCENFMDAWQSLLDHGEQDGYKISEDPGLMIEIYNEPLCGEENSAANWTKWKTAFQPLIYEARNKGFNNLLIVDGVRCGKFAPISNLFELDDPLKKTVLGLHPYPLKLSSISYYLPSDWELAFGSYCESKACLATEWSTSSMNSCYPYPAPAQSPGLSSPELARSMMSYLNSKGLGQVFWPGDYTGPLLNIHNGNPTVFQDVNTFGCGDASSVPRRGMGTMIKSYFLTGDLAEIL